MSYDNPWIYKDQVFDEMLTRENYGFVYKITNLLTGRMYIGRKYFYSKRKRKLIESDWKEYYGSCDELILDIKAHGANNFKREILSLHATRGAVNYYENVELFSRDVLFTKNPDGTRTYYNSNIMSRYFCNSTVKISPRIKKKMLAAHDPEAKTKKRKKVKPHE